MRFLPRHCSRVFSLVVLAGGLVAVESALASDFAEPPAQWGTRPLWFWNAKLDADKTRAQVAACHAAGYHGLGILPGDHMGVDFMSPEFLQHYQVAVEEAARLGMKMCLYDEYWFPSGSAGGLLAKKHPEALSKRLDMLATDVNGPHAFTQTLPEGTLMGVVAMEATTKKRRDISAAVTAGTLRWQVPDGAWKIMIFTCVRDGGQGLVDYLEPQAVQAFIDLTYQTYGTAMPAHFGTTIDSAFYDEPAFYLVQGGRAWTERFNERFRARHHREALTLYPALWFDIGPETAAARYALLNMRAELFATGFVKTIGDWCAAHHMGLTGHADQEELTNPVISTVGDLIKAFKYQSMPGIDQIFWYGRTSRAYKVVSSAANNYDRAQVMVECHGATWNMPVANLYKEAMDLFAKGINTMVPHAVWYDPAKIIQPNLSPDAATYGPELPAYNRYLGRLQRLLQGGRHVADLGVLYPIANLQAVSWFAPGDYVQGCVEVPEADYMQVGEALSLGVRRDFTYVHPETLDERCSVDGATITLNNSVNREQWRAFILPGSRYINVGTLRRLKKFYDQGGAIIATTRLPDGAVEFGAEAEVRQLVAAIFGPQTTTQNPLPRLSASSTFLGGAYEPGMIVDGNIQTRWSAVDGSKGPSWLEVDFGGEQTVTGAVTSDYLDRVRQYRIQTWDGAGWLDQAQGEKIGAHKVDTFAAVKTSKVRLHLDASAGTASIAEWAIRGADGRDLLQRSALPCHRNAAGGRAWFLPLPQVAALKAVLDEALPAGDVVFETGVETPNGNLSYIHKVKEGRHLYFFGNSSDRAVEVPVRLRGRLTLQAWDPHSGRRSDLPATLVRSGSQDLTRVVLRLEAIRSLFLVADEEKP